MYFVNVAVKLDLINKESKKNNDKKNPLVPIQEGCKEREVCVGFTHSWSSLEGHFHILALPAKQ